MKKCPGCSRIFDDDNDYCLEDGTLLVGDSGGISLGTFQSSGEMPTQYVPQQKNTVPASNRSTSNVLYLLVGIFATASIGLGLYLFVTWSLGNLSESVSANTQQNTNARFDQPTSHIASTKETNTIEPPVNANLSPAGSWSGEWNSPSGAFLTAEVTLRDMGGGRVDGEIVWTLRRTVSQAKKDKVGYSASEFVRGEFNPLSRGLSLKGYRKDDPSDVLSNLDTYRLTLNPNNSQITGVTSNFGRWNGRFSLSRR